MTLTISQKYSVKFEEYLEDINNYIYSDNTKVKLNLILDGEPSKVFRNDVPLALRRKQGTFFSDKHLAKTLFNMAKKYVSENSKIIDPTCGMGDLILPFASSIAYGKNFKDIIKLWDNQVIGYDINPLLIKATKIRLFLLAKLISKTLTSNLSLEADNSFSSINLKNFFELKLDFQKEDIIVCNPPFGSTLAFEDYKWGKGKIQTAVLFISEILERTTTGQNIFAILPDVLRSGSRYDKWRKAITKIADIVQIKTYGRFDKYTDVDVFLVHFQKKEKNNVFNVKWTPTTDKEMVAQYFDVCVGPVVPFRLKGEGENFIYINTKNALPWKGLKSLTKKIRFDGKSHMAPFVVIRRTSSPNDKYRAVPTLVNEPGSFVVENHLFVLTPKDGSVKKCKLLIKNLKNPKTNKWFNEYIRCRHLTKKSLLELPWWSDEQ